MSNANKDKSGSSWVKFDEEKDQNGPAVLNTESVQITPGGESYSIATTESEETSSHKNESQRPDPLGNNDSSQIEPAIQLNPNQLQNIPLNESVQRRQLPEYSAPVIRQGFANGDVIVSILPQNTALPWITPAKFRPELLPEELMAQGLTLTVEDYVHIMSQLVNDHRFSLYIVCYKRILMAWISLAFVILLCILFAGLQHLAMFGAGILWLMINAAAIFFCMWIKIRLNKNLERCLARINMQLLKHKILLGVDDRGKLSCHKINLCFIYFDPQECLAKLQHFIEQREIAFVPDEAHGRNKTLNDEFDIEDPDVIITGTTNTRINQQQRRAMLLLTRYAQRWIKLLNRGRLMIVADAVNRRSDVSGICPRHMATKQCICHFIEDHLKYKPEGKCLCCSNLASIIPEYFNPEYR